MTVFVIILRCNL